MTDEAEEVEPQEPEYNLELMRVLHFLHPLQNNPEDSSAAVTLGFSWAETGEGQGLFLCRGTAACQNEEDCGRLFWDDVNEELQTGHKVEVPMPWTDREGDQVVFEVWCCENCEIVGSGAVFDVWVGRFFDIPARLIAYVHESRAHTYTGLRKSLGEQYPDEFNETSFVTLVLYRRTL